MQFGGWRLTKSTYKSLKTRSFVLLIFRIYPQMYPHRARMKFFPAFRFNFKFRGCEKMTGTAVSGLCSSQGLNTPIPSLCCRSGAGAESVLCPRFEGAVGQQETTGFPVESQTGKAVFSVAIRSIAGFRYRLPLRDRHPTPSIGWCFDQCLAGPSMRQKISLISHVKK